MEKKRIHPMVLEAQEDLKKGNLSRRGFLRLATLLGLSVSSARLLGFGSISKAEAAATANIVRGGRFKGGHAYRASGSSRTFFPGQPVTSLATRI